MNGLKKFLQLFSSKCAGTGADRIQDDRVAKGICLLSGKDAGLYFGNVRYSGIQKGSMTERSDFFDFLFILSHYGTSAGCKQ